MHCIFWTRILLRRTTSSRLLSWSFPHSDISPTCWLACRLLHHAGCRFWQGCLFLLRCVLLRERLDLSLFSNVLGVFSPDPSCLLLSQPLAKVYSAFPILCRFRSPSVKGVQPRAFDDPECPSQMSPDCSFGRNPSLLIRRWEHCWTCRPDFWNCLQKMCYATILGTRLGHYVACVCLDQPMFRLYIGVFPAYRRKFCQWLLHCLLRRLCSGLFQPHCPNADWNLYGPWHHWDQSLGSRVPNTVFLASSVGTFELILIASLIACDLDEVRKLTEMSDICITFPGNKLIAWSFPKQLCLRALQSAVLILAEPWFLEKFDNLSCGHPALVLRKFACLCLSSLRFPESRCSEPTVFYPLELAYGGVSICSP